MKPTAGKDGGAFAVVKPTAGKDGGAFAVVKPTAGKDGGAFAGRLGCKALEEVRWNTLSFELFVPLSCTCPVPSCGREGVLFSTVVRNL